MPDQPNEILRNRSRNLASLVATAGGGLGVALVLSAGTSAGFWAKAVGLAATTLLLVGAALLAVGSNIQPKLVTPSSRASPTWLIPWEVAYEESTYPDLEHDVARRIIAFSRLGTIATLLSVPSLIVALALTVLPTVQLVNVLVEPRTKAFQVPGCGLISHPFSAAITVSELNDPPEYLKVRLAASDCPDNPDHAVEAILPLSSISIGVTTE